MPKQNKPSLMFESKAGAYQSKASLPLFKNMLLKARVYITIKQNKPSLMLSYCAQALFKNILHKARLYVTGKQKQTSFIIESKAGAFPS